MDTRAATWLTVDAGRHGIAPDARWLSIRQIASNLGDGNIRVRRDWYETWLGQLEQ
jgi:hypothetical protein